MTDQDILSTLEQTALFEALSVDEIARIVEMGRIEYWKEGATLLEEGAYGPRMMVLLDGECEVVRHDSEGRPRRIARVSAGTILGETSLLLRVPRVATVRALGALKVFAMDRSLFEERVASRDPAILLLALQLSRELARRVMTLNDRVLELVRQEDEAEALSQVRLELFALWDY